VIESFGEANTAALIGLLGGVFLGFAARLGRFCTLGAIEDFLYGGDDRRLRMWAIAVGTAIIGTHTILSLGWFDPSETNYLSIKWNPLASIIGGLRFAIVGPCSRHGFVRLFRHVRSTGLRQGVAFPRRDGGE